jgi:hypothetical protein
VSASCPAPAELLRYALNRPKDPVGEAVGRHVNGCSACLAETQRISEAAGALRSVASVGGPRTGQCLDEFTVAALADGDLSGAARADVIAHLAVCPRCREQVVSVVRILRDPSVGAALTPREARRGARRAPRAWMSRRRWITGASALTGLAAAAVLVVLLRPDDPGRAIEVAPPTTPVHRDQAITLTRGPRPINPTGAGAPRDTLHWTSVPHADRYRVVVFDRDGKAVFDTQTTDTTLALPEALRAGAGQVHLWRVAARTGWDRWVESELVELKRAPPRPSEP